MWQRLGLGVWDRRWRHDVGRHGTHGLCRGQWLCLDGFRWCRRCLDPGHGRDDGSGQRLGCGLWRLHGSRFRLGYRHGLGRRGRFGGGRRRGTGFWRRRGLGLRRQRLGGRHRGGLFCWRQGLGRFHLGFGGFRLRRRQQGYDHRRLGFLDRRGCVRQPATALPGQAVQQDGEDDNAQPAPAVAGFGAGPPGQQRPENRRTGR